MPDALSMCKARCGTSRALQQANTGDNAVAMEDAILRVKLAAMKSEHRDLDDAIAVLRETASPDMLQIARLKKRKLRLKDEIANIEDRLLPDIIA